ncbi:hypothetical protein KR009_007447 [Drosophila setifemur]|nr:hypothetical protein KR009_007447 [Drosophila setifemur]
MAPRQHDSIRSHPTDCGYPQSANLFPWKISPPPRTKANDFPCSKQTHLRSNGETKQLSKQNDSVHGCRLQFASTVWGCCNDPSSDSDSRSRSDSNFSSSSSDDS